VSILNLVLAGLLLVLALRTFAARRGVAGPRPLGDWLYIAAMLLMAVPLLLGRSLILLSILGVLLLIGAQIWAGYSAARKK
jgi:hypothetical protein